MARLPRLTLAGYPHHIILRGNNRQAIFMDNADFQRMLALLQAHAIEQGVQVHAYVLMSNHLHLLLTPLQNDSLPKMMQAVGARMCCISTSAMGEAAPCGRVATVLR